MAGANEVEIVVTGKDKSGPAFDSARRGADRLEKEGGSSASGLSGKLTALAASAGAAAATIAVDLASKALGALKAYAGGAIDAASNLNESFNAVDKIFKQNAQTIKDWGATQANAYGLSQRAFQEYATPLGALLKNQGVAQDKLADTTINLTKRAADLASVFNTDVPDALEALTAGLRGETDPLERYGVSLNAAQVEAEALAMTGKKTAASLTDQEKAAARLKLIFDQTADSAGDFRDTSDGLANSSRILQARQEELQATIGQKLLPVMLKLNEIKLAALDYIGTTLLPLLERNLAKITDGFREVWEKALPALQRMLELVKEKWEENRESIEKLEPLLKALGVFLGVTLVAALTVVFGLVMLFIDWIGKVGDAFQDWRNGMDVLVVALLRGFGKILDAAVEAFSWIPGIGPKLKEAQDKFHSFADSLINDIARAQKKGSEGIGVAVHVSGLNQLSQAISDVLWLSSHPVSQGIGTRAHGGVIGAAATGGIRNGLTKVGEHGRELALLAPGVAQLPPGSTVIPNGATENALSGGGGAGGPVINIYVQGSIRSDRDLIRIIRDEFQRGGFRGVVKAA